MTAVGGDDLPVHRSVGPTAANTPSRGGKWLIRMLPIQPPGRSLFSERAWERSHSLAFPTLAFQLSPHVKEAS
ncbi:hypothetical protein SUDANB9_07364 [Streptomyces sp. enrichment culture]